MSLKLKNKKYNTIQMTEKIKEECLSVCKRSI